MSTTACATCAQPFSPSAPTSEKPPIPSRTLPCCARTICIRCTTSNPRYQTYCPYCQITSTPSALPQGLRDPPAYASLQEYSIPPPPGPEEEELPAYSEDGGVWASAEKGGKEGGGEDVLHFVAPTDTMLSLSLAYDVPLPVLRRTNKLFADHLLQARRTVIVPGSHYKGGVSLSPRPLEGEEEEVRKGKLRRWMMGCKVAEYDVATLYLEQAEWDLEAAIEAYKEDERWEKEHPMEAQQKGKKGKSAKNVGMRRFVG